MKSRFLVLLVLALLVLPVHGSASPIPVPPELWVMGFDGTNQRLVTDKLGFGANFSWAPDSQTIVFEGVDGLFTIDLQGGVESRLTTAADAEPDWSVNNEIAFQRAHQEGSAIYAIGADGSQAREIVDAPGSDARPSWSPDGTLLAFISTTPGEQPQVYVVNRDGSGLRRLSSHGSLHLQPKWSPDGNWLLYTSVDYEIYRIAVDGSAETSLTESSPAGDLRALSSDWSPDGARIVFTAAQEQEIDAFFNGIWIMNADGTSKEFLVQGGSPDWGANGKIAFSQGHDIYLTEPHTPGQPNLTNTTDRSERAPRWSPDASKMAFPSEALASDPPPIARSISLKARRHLVLSGRLRVTSPGAECLEAVVKLQRMTANGWRTVAKTTAGDDGSFRRKVRDRRGFYRAVAPKTRGFSGWQEADCLRAVTDVVRHQH